MALSESTVPLTTSRFRIGINAGWQSRGLQYWFPGGPYSAESSMRSYGRKQLQMTAQGAPSRTRTAMGDVWRYTSTPDYWYSGSTLAVPPYTVSGWFYPDESSFGTYRCLFAQARTDGSRWVLLETESDGAGARLDLRMFNGAFANVQTTVAVNKKAWNHFVAVLESGQGTVYLNGGNAGTVSHAVTSDTNGFSVGGFRYGSTTSDTNVGMISDFRIYDYAMTRAMVKSLFSPATRWDLYRSVSAENAQFRQQADAGPFPHYTRRILTGGIPVGVF